LGVALFGLALPLIVAIFLIHRTPPTVTSLSDPPRTAWTFLVLSLLFTQFYRIDSNPPWLIMDDGRELFFGLQLSRHWDWRMQWGPTQIQPLFLWILGVLFKVFTPSMVLYRLVPAVFFLGAVASAYWGTRAFFPRSRAFLTAALLSLGFFPYILSRQPQATVLFLAAEFLVFGLLGRLLLQNKTGTILRGGVLGCVLGLGVYIYSSWPTVALWTCLILIAAWANNPRKYAKPVWTALGMAVLIAGPLVAAYLEPHGADYFKSKLSLHRWGLYFIEGIFWRGHGSVPYGPNWGGLLNPLAGALLLVGCLQSWRERRSRSFFFPLC